jgi:general secretion pathway protein J
MKQIRCGQIRRPPQGGFTLLEVLVAVIIFALLGMAAYSGLDAVLKARARLDDENRQWRAVALFWNRLDMIFPPL